MTNLECKLQEDVRWLLVTACTCIGGLRRHHWVPHISSRLWREMADILLHLRHNSTHQMPALYHTALQPSACWHTLKLSQMNLHTRKTKCTWARIYTHTYTRAHTSSHTHTRGKVLYYNFTQKEVTSRMALQMLGASLQTSDSWHTPLLFLIQGSHSLNKHEKISSIP